jgi:hypothetical protein
MSKVASPFPPGTTERVIWVDGEGNVLPGQDGATGGEIIVTYPDGRREHHLFGVRRTGAAHPGHRTSR